MKSSIKIILGSMVFIACVFNPIRANLLAAIAKQYQLDIQSQITLFAFASEIDPCMTDFLDSLGDNYISLKNATMATIVYGKAIVCSPANSRARFKFGESLLLMGFDGRSNIEDALRLEPHNPLYKSEVDRLTKLQWQFQ